MKRMKVCVAILACLFLALPACSGSDGMDGTSCTVTDMEESDDVLIECEDGTTATVTDGEDGSSCTVADNGDGTKTISCDDGTTATVSDGVDGSSCTVADNGDGTKTISCDDGTSVDVSDGQDGGSCTVTDNGDGTVTVSCDDGTSATVSDGADGSSCTVTDNGDGTQTISCDDGTSTTFDSLIAESFNFPTSSDPINLSASQYMFEAGHYIEGTRTLSTVDAALAVKLDLTLSENSLGCGETLDVNVLVNGTVFKSLNVTDADTSVQATVGGSIQPDANGDIVVRLEATNTIAGGCGSIVFENGGSMEVIGL